MHLKLTLAYDGTGFRGWARQPGERTVEGVLGEALEAVFASSGGSRSPAAPTPACTRSRTSPRSRSTGGPPPERAAEALNAVLPAGRRDRPRRGGAGGLPRAPLRPLALVPLPHLAPPRRARRSRSNRSLWHPRPLDLQRLAGLGGDARRRARLPRLHADRHPARGLRPRRRGRALARPRRHARARDHRRLVPAPHGADARRHDARARAGRARRPAPGRAALGGRLDRARRAASTSSASATTIAQRSPRRPRTARWLRSGACASRSSSSISTAPSSTPAGSSSPRCGTRRGRCSGARSPTRR